VNQRGGLQRGSLPLVCHLRGSQVSEFSIYEREKFVGGLRIPLIHPIKDARHLAHFVTVFDCRSQQKLEKLPCSICAVKAKTCASPCRSNTIDSYLLMARRYPSNLPSFICEPKNHDRVLELSEVIEAGAAGFRHSRACGDKSSNNFEMHWIANASAGAPCQQRVRAIQSRLATT